MDIVKLLYLISLHFFNSAILFDRLFSTGFLNDSSFFTFAYNWLVLGVGGGGL